VPPSFARRLTVDSLEDRTTPVAGHFDPTFGVEGVAPVPQTGPLAVQPDGKIVILGTSSFTEAILRLNPDGSLDPTFGTAGVATLSESIAPRALAIQSDGKIVLAGAGATVQRLNADGSLDTTFGTNGTVNFVFDQTQNYLNAIALQPDGKIVLAGSTEVYRYTVIDMLTAADGSMAVARLNPDGSPDTTFDGDGKVTVRLPFGDNNYASARKVAVQSDGTIVLGGEMLAVSTLTPTSRSRYRTDYYDLAVVRLTPTGQLDSAFGDGGKVRVSFDVADRNTDTLTAFGVRPDGSILLAGTEHSRPDPTNFGSYTNVAALLLPNGTFDPSFDGDGKAWGHLNETGPAAIAPDGAVVFAAGRSVIRLTPTGQLDTVIGPPYGFTSNMAGTTDVLVQPDSRILLAGGEMVGRLLGAPPPPGAGSFLSGGVPDGTATLAVPTLFNTQQAVWTDTFFPGASVTVRTALADVNGDGVMDLIGGSGPSGGPHVKVIDGNSNYLIGEFFAFEGTFSGGVFVAAADLTGDGKADIVVTPDQSGGPVVAIYDGAKLVPQPANGGTAAQIARFFGIDDPNFRGGARPTVGDFNGDGKPEVVVAAGFGGGPRVTIWDGKSVLGASPVQLANFFAFETTLRNGSFVSAGDVDGDGVPDLALGGGPGGAPRVRVVSGTTLMESASQGLSSLDGTPGSTPVPMLADFFAGNVTKRGGVHVLLRDYNADGKADLYAGSGNGEPSRVLISSLVTDPATGLLEADFFHVPLVEGVFVG
jgi:uncharacterized delta-60 repeat protein